MHLQTFIAHPLDYNVYTHVHWIDQFGRTWEWGTWVPRRQVITIDKFLTLTCEWEKGRNIICTGWCAMSSRVSPLLPSPSTPPTCPNRDRSSPCTAHRSPGRNTIRSAVGREHHHPFVLSGYSSRSANPPSPRMCYSDCHHTEYEINWWECSSGPFGMYKLLLLAQLGEEKVQITRQKNH